jgi:hypothetical protein
VRAALARAEEGDQRIELRLLFKAGGNIPAPARRRPVDIPLFIAGCRGNDGGGKFRPARRAIGNIVREIGLRGKPLQIPLGTLNAARRFSRDLRLAHAETAGIRRGDIHDDIDGRPHAGAVFRQYDFTAFQNGGDFPRLEARNTARVIARRAGIYIRRHTALRRGSANFATFVENAAENAIQKTAAAHAAAQHIEKRPRDRLLHGHARDVGDDGIGKVAQALQAFATGRDKSTIASSVAFMPSVKAFSTADAASSACSR